MIVLIIFAIGSLTGSNIAATILVLVVYVRNARLFALKLSELCRALR